MNYTSDTETHRKIDCIVILTSIWLRFFNLVMVSFSPQNLRFFIRFSFLSLELRMSFQSRPGLPL